MNGKRKHFVGVLSTLLLFPTALAAAAPDAAPEPWSISDGTANSDLYVSRHIEKSYAKGSRSRDGKRPLPLDVFSSFNNAGVGSYNWFFENWFFGYNFMDLKLAGVRTEGGTHTVSVHNEGGMAMPFDLFLTYADGSSERVHRTPAVWKANGRATDVTIPGGKALSAVALDTGIFVDFNPADNNWKP